jgi:hypothetical protein
MMELTPAVKRRITRDWARYFPSMTFYKPGWLLRRVGPMVMGICFNRNADGSAYIPRTHVHNLANSSPGISLALARELSIEPTTVHPNGFPDIIPVKQHEERLQEAAARLHKQSVLPFSGNVQLEEVVQAYRLYRSPKYFVFTIDLLEDPVYFATWCGRKDMAAQLLEEARTTAAKLSEMMARYEGVDKWYESLVSRVQDAEVLRRNVGKEIQEHKLDKVATADLLCEE